MRWGADMQLNYDAIDEILPLDDVKKFARIERTDEDELITSLIYSAVFQIEDETGHLFGVREVTETFVDFASVKLRAAPIRSISTVSYRDSANDLVVFDPAGLRVVAGT